MASKSGTGWWYARWSSFFIGDREPDREAAAGGDDGGLNDGKRGVVAAVRKGYETDDRGNFALMSGLRGRSGAGRVRHASGGTTDSGADGSIRDSRCEACAGGSHSRVRG